MARASKIQPMVASVMHFRLLDQYLTLYVERTKDKIYIIRAQLFDQDVPIEGAPNREPLMEWEAGVGSA